MAADPMGRDHDHSDQLRRSGKRNLTLALVLIVGYMFAEIVGGIISGSLALIADAGHMLAALGGFGLDPRRALAAAGQLRRLRRGSPAGFPGR